MAKLSRPVIYALVLAVVGYAGFVLTEPEVKPLTTKKRVATIKPKTKGTSYTEEDYRAKFTPVNMGLKNAFKPEVTRNASGAMEPLASNGIPTAFTGGDPNWLYTGNAEQDGALMALFENPVTGEGEFVKKGDRWKLAVIVSINSDSITLSGNDGLVKTVQMGSQEPSESEAPISPVRPALSGPIEGLTVTPVQVPEQPTRGRGQRAN